jgi:hypothetical protein
MTILSQDGLSKGTNNQDPEIAVAPGYALVTPVSEYDTPIVTAYPISEEVYNTQHNDGNMPYATGSSFMPTATPTVGTYSKGPVALSSSQQTNVSHTAATGSVTYSNTLPGVQEQYQPQYPAPPPPRGLGNNNQRLKCLCGSISITIFTLLCLCCIVPIIVVAIIAYNANKGMMWNDDDFTNLFDDAVDGTQQDDRFLNSTN